MAQHYALEPDEFKRVIKATCGLQKATDEEFLAFLAVAHEHGLNPLTREIFAFQRPGGGIQHIVSVDGWLKKMNEHPAFDGIRYADTVNDGGQLVAVTCRIYRKDRRHPTEVTEYLRENRRQTDQWTQRPARMLRHRATIQCIRTAFNLAGIMEQDEFDAWVERAKAMNGPATQAGDDSPEDWPGATRGQVSPPTGAVVEVSVETGVSPKINPPPHSESRKKGSSAPPLPQVDPAPPPPEPDKPDELISEEDQDRLVKAGDVVGLTMSKLLRYVREHYQVGDLRELRQSQAKQLQVDFRRMGEEQARR